MTDDEIERAFAYGDLPRTDELWVCFRDYVERWEAMRESEYKASLARIREENPGVLFQGPIPPRRLTPKTLEWLESNVEEAKAEAREARMSEAKTVQSRERESHSNRTQHEDFRQETMLLRSFLESQVVEANMLLRGALDSSRRARLWFGGSTISVLVSPLIVALAWLEGRSLLGTTSVTAAFIALGFASGWYFRRQALMGFQRLQVSAERFADAGFIVYKKQVFLSSELAVVPKHAAGERVAIELGTVTLEAFERTVG
jgi:hypothetical protein